MNQRSPELIVLGLAVLVTACNRPPESSTPSVDPDAAAPEELRGPSELPSEIRRLLTDLSPAELPPPPADPTNRYVEDPAAAELGKKFFFESRFSGPLLDESNNGLTGTLGMKGEAGKVACAGCHVPEAGFLDARSPRRQISLGAGWTRRRAPSLLDVGQSSFLMWDGRHDTAFGQPFTPIEDPQELNSSRLFVAQQVARLYKAEYEAIFGALPPLDGFPSLTPNEAGCVELPKDLAHGRCPKPGQDDEAVTRVVVNVGKAIQAFTRKLQCGRSRFDRWMDGDAAALTPEEQAGALLFVGKAGCISCHSGPYLTDLKFHNVGLDPDFTFFVAPLDDQGASEGVSTMLADPLNSKGKFSDGYDGRQEKLPADRSSLLGAFRTPSLRCVSRRPSFMHTGQYRSLDDVVIFFNRGGDPEGGGYPGKPENFPRNLSSEERAQLGAFLRSLDGDGPAPELVTPPELPAK
jgi:cytochrome c peroxidase